MVDLNRIATEQRNPDTMDIDRVSTLEMVREINSTQVADEDVLTDSVYEVVDGKIVKAA